MFYHRKYHVGYVNSNVGINAFGNNQWIVVMQIAYSLWKLMF